jgi:hypothetical protein
MHPRAMDATNSQAQFWASVKIGKKPDTKLHAKESVGNMANVEVTGAARLYRAASSDRRERGQPPG